MRAGTLNRRLWIDQPVTSRDTAGAEEITWEPFREVWAAIEPIRGREALINSANLAQLDTKIRIRWTPTIAQVTPKWRGRYQGTTYDFVTVAHVKIGRREVEILAKSGTNEG